MGLFRTRPRTRTKSRVAVHPWVHPPPQPSAPQELEQRLVEARRGLDVRDVPDTWQLDQLRPRDGRGGPAAQLRILSQRVEHLLRQAAAAEGGPVGLAERSEERRV